MNEIMPAFNHQFAHEKGICVDDCPLCEAVRRQHHNRGLCDPNVCSYCVPTRGESEGIHLTLDRRGSKYGDYGYMATCAQRIKEAMGPRANMSAVQRESLDMIATKIARIVCGDPNHYDSWHDIQGYAKLAEDRLPPPPESASQRDDPATP